MLVKGVQGTNGGASNSFEWRHHTYSKLYIDFIRRRHWSNWIKYVLSPWCTYIIIIYIFIPLGPIRLDRGNRFRHPFAFGMRPHETHNPAGRIDRFRVPCPNVPNIAQVASDTESRNTTHYFDVDQFVGCGGIVYDRHWQVNNTIGIWINNKQHPLNVKSLPKSNHNNSINISTDWNQIYYS